MAECFPSQFVCGYVVHTQITCCLGFKSLLSWSVFCILLVYIDDPECCDSMLNKSSLLNRSLSGKPYSEIVWRIDSFQAFGERKFDELIYQPIGYQLKVLIWIVLVRQIMDNLPNLLNFPLPNFLAIRQFKSEKQELKQILLSKWSRNT